MKYTITSLLLFVLLTAGCNNQPQNTQNDIATPVSVTKLKKGSISKLVNTTGTAYLWSNAQFRNEWLVQTANQSPYRQAL